MSILADIFTILLALLSLFLILVILMQRGNANGGMGAAMGGGMAETALGADSSNVLTKVTRNTAIIYFVMVFGLGLAYIHFNNASEADSGDALPEFESSPAGAAALFESPTGEDAAAAAAEAEQPAKDASAAAEEKPNE